MQTGDTVRVRHHGRTYLAEITDITSRTAHIRFYSQVPVLDLHRKRERAVPLKVLHEYKKCGVDYVLEAK